MKKIEKAEIYKRTNTDGYNGYDEYVVDCPICEKEFILHDMPNEHPKMIKCCIEFIPEMT